MGYGKNGIWDMGHRKWDMMETAQGNIRMKVIKDQEGSIAKMCICQLYNYTSCGYRYTGDLKCQWVLKCTKKKDALIVLYFSGDIYMEHINVIIRCQCFTWQ